MSLVSSQNMSYDSVSIQNKNNQLRNVRTPFGELIIVQDALNSVCGSSDSFLTGFCDCIARGLNIVGNRRRECSNVLSHIDNVCLSRAKQ